MDYVKIREWASESGGYEIMEPQFFRDMGVPENAVQTLARTFSDDHESLGKHAATRADGNPGEVWGISEFALINYVALKIGIQPSDAFYGRGKNFRITVSRVVKELDKRISSA